MGATSQVPVIIDLIFHLLVFLIQLAILNVGQFHQNGSTPPFVYPFFLILAAHVLYRQHESIDFFQSRRILIPSILATLIFGFCLIVELGGTFWAFIIPRQFPVWVRIVWFQLLFILLLPSIYHKGIVLITHVFSSLSESPRDRINLIVFVIIFGIFLWLVRSHNITPDGYDWLRHSRVPKNWANYLREPLGTLLFRLSALAGQTWFHWVPHTSIAVLIISSGCMASCLLIFVVKRIFQVEFACLVFVLLLSCAGLTQVFAGNIEIYGLLQCFFSLYLFTVFFYLERGGGAWLPGFTFGLLFCIHLSAVWWLPSLLLLPLLKSIHKQKSLLLTKEILKIIVPCLVIILLFGAFVLFYRYEGNLQQLLEHFWSDQVMFVGADAAMFHSLSTFFTTDYYLTMFNEYIYLMPGVLILGIIWLAAWPYWQRLTPLQLWLLVLTGPYIIYSMIWHPDRPYAMDWDIFSGVTIPVVLLLATLITRLKLSAACIQFILYQSVVFSFMFLSMQLLRNHTKITEWPLF